VLVNLQLRLRERLALSSLYDEQLAMAAADAVGPLRASAAVLLWLESGARLAPRDALRQIADETGTAAALGATLVGAIELANQLAARTERLA
jgi:hypothetical protein